MSKHGSDLRSILTEIDSVLDDVLRKMDDWEEELHRTMRKGDNEQVMEVAQKGNAFSRNSREVRDELLEAKSSHKDDLSDGALDEANAAVEAKLDQIDARLQRAMEEVLARQETMGEKMRKTIEDMEGLQGLSSDSDDEEDMRKMKEELSKEKKAKR